MTVRGLLLRILAVLLVMAWAPHGRAQQQFATAGGSVQPLGNDACPAADGTDEDRTYPIRKLAFEADAAGRYDVARHLMRCAIRANPKDLTALKQEVYLDLNAKDNQEAIEDIDALRGLGAATAQLEAQQGYIYANEKKYGEARSAFGRAIAFGDAAVTAQAMGAIRVLDGEFPRHVLSVSVDSEYLNRFDDGIVDAGAKYSERIGSRSPFLVFGTARLLRDTASNGGTLPQIFSDNAFLTGAGLAFQPHGAPFMVSAEANEAYVFYGSKTGGGALVPDYRAIGGYYQTWRAGPDTKLGDRFSVEANGSLGFYSRYQHDAIAYLQPREIVDVARQGSLRISGFLQESVALDTNRQFYNNIFELIPGVQVTNAKLGGLALRVEYVRGYYLPDANASANPYGTSYNDFRFRLIFQKNIPLGLGAR